MGTFLFFSRKNRNVPIFLATIGGLGRIPWAPGTWGSLVGLLLGMFVVRILQWAVHPVAIIASFVGCALICTMAERALHRHDPSEVILDEVWGMWVIVVVLPWITVSFLKLLIAFLLFRLFDVAKPAPLRHLERLPAGLGIMADDLGAAVYSIIMLWLVQRLIPS